MDQDNHGDHDHDHDQDQATKQPNGHDDHHNQRNVPFTRLRGHVDNTFSALGTIDSESSNDDETNAYNCEDYEFFESSGFEFDSELGFLDEQYSDDDDEDYEEMDEDEDEIDVDELTYEELLALGEFIGVEQRGLPYKEISSCLRPIVVKTTSVKESQKNSVIDRCVICQVEYEDDENLVALHCEHSYHSECITKWLHIKKSCPICSSEISSSSSSSSPSSSSTKNKDL